MLWTIKKNRQFIGSAEHSRAPLSLALITDYLNGKYEPALQDTKKSIAYFKLPLFFFSLPEITECGIETDRIAEKIALF